MYEFSVYSLNTSHEYFIPYIPLSNSSYLEEQYCMQVRQHITIHKATKQIWYTVSKSHICNAVLLLPHTHTHTHTHTHKHNNGRNKEMYRTWHSWRIDTSHWKWHSSEVMDMSLLTHYTQWSDSMQCWLSVQVYTSWLWQNKALHITEDYHIQHFRALLLWKYASSGGRDRDITTNISTHRMKQKTYCLIWWLQETYLLLSIIVQMWHEKRHSMPHYKSTLQVLKASFRNKIKHDHFYHILRSPHFSDNKN